MRSSKLPGLLGVVGLAIAEGLVSLCMIPDIGYWHLAGNVAAAYVLVFLIMLSGQSLPETLVIIAMVSVIGLLSLSAGGDKLGDAGRALVWSLLLAAWYLPLFVASMARVLSPEDADDSPDVSKQAGGSHQDRGLR